MSKLFDGNTKVELEVLIKGLESLQLNSWDKLTDDEKEHVSLCLGTLYWQLNERYKKWEKKDE